MAPVDHSQASQAVFRHTIFNIIDCLLTNQESCAIMNYEDRAFVQAPLSMPFAFLGCAWFLGLSGFTLEDGLLNYLASVAIIIVGGMPVVYLYEFFIAYRFYRLLLKKGKVNIFSMAFGGAFIAVLPILMVMPFSGYAGVETAFILFGFSGFVVGLTFWLLLKRGEKKAAVGR
ncbi:hypothetical protein imdm_883 [gamma proteobacterium IMCC2047]|nr:hypothetical protein imdm_883 [gamma proteobacterium IMCC2047]